MENRVEQTTVANKETDARLSPIAEEQVFWTPGRAITLGATIAVSLLASVGSVIAAGIFTPATLIGAALAGLSTGLATFFGIKSGGSPK